MSAFIFILFEKIQIYLYMFHVWKQPILGAGWEVIVNSQKWEFFCQKLTEMSHLHWKTFSTTLIPRGWGGKGWGKVPKGFFLRSCMKCAYSTQKVMFAKPHPSGVDWELLANKMSFAKNNMICPHLHRSLVFNPYPNGCEGQGQV